MNHLERIPRFIKATFPKATKEQAHEVRKVFMAGATSLRYLIAEAHNMPEGLCEERLDAINTELNEFSIKMRTEAIQ